MYNGIGVSAQRGTGSNAHVQRNLSHIDNTRQSKPYTEYNAKVDIRKLEEMLNCEPSKELLMHECKRQNELKCIELEELMESHEYESLEIEQKVNEYHKLLLKEIESVKCGSDTLNTIEVDEYGRHKCMRCFGSTFKSLRFLRGQHVIHTAERYCNSTRTRQLKEHLALITTLKASQC